jgi:endoglucanase
MKIINLIGEPSAGKSTIAAELFAKMKSQFVDKGIPVILGEYGAMVRHII